MMRDMHVQGPQINQFNNIAPNPIPRSAFKRNFTRRSTFNQDYLIPIFVDEILPGDDVNVKMTALCRMSTPIKPLMDNLYLETFWFFVPNRLVWTNWVKLQGQQANPADSVAYTVPTLNLAAVQFNVNSIFDYLGLPINVTGLDNISALYNRAYDLVWNEWFRDENLQDSLTVATGDGPDTASTYDLRKRNKRKDYFTSCLPSPQKGTAVSINLTGSAPVTLSSTLSVPQLIRKSTDHALAPSISQFTTAATTAQWQNSDGSIKTLLDPNGTLEVAGSAFSAITINSLRQSALYQQILELDARGGTRYVESIYSRFGVVSPDFRLQRPELIGQGSTRINVYSVPQTAATGVSGTPQGNLAAFGTATIQGDHGCRYSATEHGMILGLANVRADLTYQQGVPKRFLRSTRLDFYEPLLNGLGEQTVTKGELFATGTSTDTDPFGYQERFAEYRFMNSEITGLFRSDATGTLDVWHLSQDLSSATLNSAFITEAVPMSRILAVSTEPSFLFDAYYDYTHVRPMPVRSNPGIDKL